MTVSTAYIQGDDWQISCPRAVYTASTNKHSQGDISMNNEELLPGYRPGYEREAGDRAPRNWDIQGVGYLGDRVGYHGWGRIS